MQKSSSDFQSNFREIASLVQCLKKAIYDYDRANIVRSCSNIMYSLSDMLEKAIPDGVKISIH